MEKASRWNNRQLQHYSPAIEGKTDPRRFRMFIEKILPPPPLKVIDCGCAGGDVTNNISKRGYEVIGLYYPEIINKTSNKYPNLKLVACNLNMGIPASIGKIDWIYASEILEHLTHDFDFLVSCHNHLKLDGWLYLTVPKSAEKWSAHLRHYPKESLKNLFWAAGFNNIREGETSASSIIIGKKEE